MNFIKFNIFIFCYLLTGYSFASNYIIVHGTNAQTYGYGQVHGYIVEATCIPESIFPVDKYHLSHGEKKKINSGVISKNLHFGFSLTGCSPSVKKYLK